MKSGSLTERALSLLRKTHKIRELVLVHSGSATDTHTGETIHDFSAVAAKEPNGPSYRILLKADGSMHEGQASADALTLASARAHLRPTAALPPVAIQPDTNVLNLNPGDEIDETITVTIPKNAVTPKADIYFLADTTGSMSDILAAVQAGANNVLNSLNSLGLDLRFGVGNYRDFPASAPSPFFHQLNPENVAANITAAVGSWSASGGGDRPEGQFFALDQLAQPPGGSVGWRSGAKRIIVWFGDAPGHDPICTSISGLSAAITAASVTAKLAAEQIVVLAISTATPGLDDNPVTSSFEYAAVCGPPGGAAGQASRLAAATGGAFVTGIDPTNIVNTIVNLLTAAVSHINNLKLVPSVAIAPFVASIAPEGFGPLNGDTKHVLKFEVKFRDIPCRDSEQFFDGTLDVVADGSVVASKKVHIIVPPCKPKTVRYSVKFVCGAREDHCSCSPVRSGHYTTLITVHNYSAETVEVEKRFIPVVLAGAAVGREPKVVRARAEDAVKLPPHTATMDDCCRITELLFGEPIDALTIGVLEIIASRDVSVTAVYTTNKSVDVVLIQGHAV